MLNGTISVHASRDTVFGFLLDPRHLSECIADPHTIQIQNTDRFRGTLRSGVGPIRGTFTWSAVVVERAPPDRARIRVHGTGMGSAFDIDATIELQESPGSTTATWHADVTLSGTIASLGGRLLQTTIDRKTNEFFESARRVLEAS
jgi:carbon monoxide dehydrogenase subunit G